AGLARIIGGVQQPHTARGQLRADLEFLRIQSQKRYFRREVLRRKQQAAALHYRNAHGIQFAVEEIGAVRRRIHPLRVQPEDSWSLGDILRDQAEARARLHRSLLQWQLAGELVRERILL